MNGRGPGKIAKRGRRTAGPGRTDPRLEHLYEISKALTRFQSVERTIPEVMAYVAQTLPLRTAIFILETAGAPKTIAWQARDESAARLQAAKAHAQTSYRYLVQTGIVLDGDGAKALDLPRQPAAGSSPREGRTHPIILPLVVDGGSIFGALQIEGAAELNEADLVFINAVVNQLAIAIDRQAAIDARQAAAEAREREQHLLADVSAAVASSLACRDTLSALARSTVPRLADLCLVDELADDGELRRLEVVLAEEGRRRALPHSMEGVRLPPGRQAALLSGQSLLLSRIADPVAEGIVGDEEQARILRAAGVQSMMVVPLRAHGKTLGAITFAAAESGRRYSTHDLALAEEISRRAATAIENARLYEKAQRATLARETLLAVVSHDLRNPLGVIQLSVSTLLRAGDGGDPRRSGKQLAAIQRSVKRMTGMIEDLLAAASIEAGRLSVEQRRLDAAPLISEAVEALQPVAASKSVRLRSELPADLPAIHADGARLEQALVNLLDNAIKFTPEGGAVTVRAVPSGGMVTFSVADAGPGIAEAELPRLFERFWQARRTARQGTGLGLFIVKGIVDAHRGKVWAESKPGEGSTFFFSIPLAPPGAEQPARAPAEDPKARGEVPGRAPGSLQPEGGGQAAGRETLVQETEQRKRELHAAVESARVARELAERAGELRRDFTCLVSHELRGPLTALELLIERLERDRDAPPTPRQEIVIRRMFAAVARLTAIVESLLQHALLRSGRMTSQIEDFSTRALAAGVVEELRSYAEGKGLDLRLAAPDDLPPLRSDPVLVRLIFQNLIGNAIKFTERGLVQVSVDCTAGVHRFAVRDSGPGIPAADQARLFEPFMQTGDAKQKHVPGMGLGLTLVREVALALGGHVELDSEVGRGSTFTVTLPPVAQESREQGVPLH